jgi:hypothetical protein
MPQLADPRWERACQERASGGDVTASYKAAGFAGRPSSATRFFKHPQVVERIQELIQTKYEDERKAREIATEEAGIDKSWILKRLKYLTDISLQKREIIKRGQVVGYGAQDGPTAVKCLHLAAQVGGLLVNRHEIGAPGDFQRMSDEELSDSLAAQAEALGIPETAIAGLLTHNKTDEAAE